MEQWKEITGHNGTYMVSNYGRVLNLITGKILSPSLSKSGYLKVDLRYGEKKTVNVHRLVATAFLDNPNNYSVVNHIDEDKTNNNASNLEWCTTKYNVNYGKAKEHLYKAVFCIDSDGNEHHYESIEKASLITGIHRGDISRVCRGERKTTHKLVWRYENES